MDLTQPKLKKLSIFALMKQLFQELSTVQRDEEGVELWPAETVFHPMSQHSYSLTYNGPVVTKSSWLNFIKEGGLTRVLTEVAKAGLKEDAKEKENTRLVRFKSVLVIDDGIYKYA